LEHRKKISLFCQTLLFVDQRDQYHWSIEKKYHYFAM